MIQSLKSVRVIHLRAVPCVIHVVIYFVTLSTPKAAVELAASGLLIAVVGALGPLVR